jgi:NitT/TauT family transport system permease protein
MSAIESEAVLRPSLGSRLSGVGLPLLGVIIAIGGWWAGTEIFQVREVFLPSPGDIAIRFMEQPGYLFRETWVTLYETLLGFAIGAIGGLIVALVFTMSRVLERATMPLFVALNAVPKTALAPMLLVWAGFGTKPKVVMAVLICFFPVIVSSMAGMSSTPSELGELTRSLQASRLQQYLKVRLPWALPQVFVGLKVAISLAVVGAVIAEIVNPGQGLGNVIVLAGYSSDTPLAFAAIVLLALLGVVLYYIVAVAERLLLPWAREISS